MPPTVAHLTSAMQRIAPTHLAEPWDQVGLHLGDPAWHIRGPILLAIDLTEAVADEAIRINAGAIIAYHPPFFRPLPRLTTDNPKARLALRLAGAGIAVYSPHTALDAVPGGVADWLIDQVATDPARPGAGTQRAALSPHAHLDHAQTHKLVVFIPREHLQPLREALTRTGAGVIGEYDHCAYELEGRGTFRASDRANPTIGKRNTIETVDEVRLETVCPARKLPDIIAALREAHPYEEPAFDLYALEPRPDPSRGPGRILTLDEPATPETLARRLRDNLRIDSVRLATRSDAPITRIAACPGSGVSLLDAAISHGAQLFITGEMKHHEVLDALDRNCAILLAGHTNTERGYLRILREKLLEAEHDFDPRLSIADIWPFSII